MIVVTVVAVTAETMMTTAAVDDVLIAIVAASTEVAADEAVADALATVSPLFYLLWENTISTIFLDVHYLNKLQIN